MLRRIPACWLVLTAAFAGLGVNACAEDEEKPGVRVEILVAPDAPQRPDSVRFFWLGPTGVMLAGRLPETGVLPQQGPLLGSLFVETEGPLGSPRALALTGYFGSVPVAGLFERLEPGPERVRRLQVTLGPPLVDSDGDGVPDVVALGCAALGLANCATADAGASDGAGASADAGAGGAPVDAGPGGPPPSDAGLPPAADAAFGGDGGGIEAGVPAPDARPVDLGPGGDAAADLPVDRPPDGPPSPPDPGGPYLLGDGVIGYWRLDEPAGSAIAQDHAGRGHTGQLLGNAASGWTTDGRLGGALAIALPGEGVRVGPTADIESIGRAFTIAAWTRRQTQRAELANVLARPSAERPEREYFALAITSSGHLKGFVNSHLEPLPPAPQSQDPLPLRQWMHVAMTYDGAFIIIYVNGVEAGRAEYSSPVVSGSRPLCLGCGFNQVGASVANEPLGGDLDEVLLYRRALHPTELVRLTAGEQPQIRN